MGPMSAPPSLRRIDKAMDEARARALLEAGFCGRRKPPA